MIDPLVAPAPGDSVERLADWMELTALRSADGNCSIQDLIAAMRRVGDAEVSARARIQVFEEEDVIGAGVLESHEQDEEPEEIEELPEGAELEDPGEEATQARAEDAFSEIEDRHDSCGGDDGGYPFEIEREYLQVRPDYEYSAYLFLLLLSHYGERAGPRGTKGASLFEWVCAQAAGEYFGGPRRGGRSYLFGFPRQKTPQQFKPALEGLIREMGEGGGCRSRPGRKSEKDARLDLVAWREFPDGRAAKLIAFGQCATGNHWRGKTSELQPRTFCGKYLSDQLAVEPARMFFIPFRMDAYNWRDVGLEAGVIFDRCRVAAFAAPIEEGDVREQCRQWSLHVLDQRVRG